MSQAVRAAIIKAAQDAGEDPAFALAIADRESSFNPAARNSKTIKGLYQMTGGLRAKYGIGDSEDPYQQTRGWAASLKDLRNEMGSAMGRAPTDSELYLGHHFGGVRAGRMVASGQDAPVSAVFSPMELAQNPHIVRAGTTGRLMSSTLADIDNRRARHADAAPDFSQFGEPVEGDTNSVTPTKSVDLAQYGTPAQAPQAPDFSSMGTPA